MLFLFTHPTQHPAVRRSDAEASPCGREPHGADGDQRPVPRGHCGGRCREGSQAGSSWNQVSRMLAIALQASAAAHARLHAPAGHRTAWSQSSPADACCPRAWQDRSRDLLGARRRSLALRWPIHRDACAGTRFVGVRGRGKERGVAIRLPAAARAAHTAEEAWV